MKIAVLGSGNGGCAVAFDYAKAGHEVNIFDFEQFPATIGAIAASGGIHAEGQLDGFAPVQYAGHDLAKAIDGAELIYTVGPAYSTEPFGEACKPHIEDGQVVVVCPSSCGGAIVFKKAVGREIDDDRIIVAETSTLPYAVRLVGPGKIHVYLRLKAGVFIAALPGDQTDRVNAMIGAVYSYMTPAQSILQTSLQNANPVIHPPVTLLNAALIERTGGDFCFYEEGVTPAAGRLIKGLDDERIAIGRKLDVEIIPDPVLGKQQGYMQTADYERGYTRAKGFRGIKAQSQLDNRYFQEDLGFGLVFMSDLARQIGVETPLMNSLIALVSTIMQRDYRAEQARTMRGLGLDQFSLEELKRL